MNKTQVNKPTPARPDGLLCDWQIIDLVEQHGMIDPFLNHKKEATLSYGLEPFGYTMTLSPKPYKRPVHTGESITIGKTEAEYIEMPAINGYVTVPPNDYILCAVNERLRMPANVQGQFLTKSTLARVGLFANVTWIDAGWHGILTVEISNLGRNPVNIPVNQGIGQIVFYAGMTPAKAYTGRYQHQEALPTPAKFGKM